MGSIRLHKTGLWRVTFYWHGKRFDIYRDPHGEAIETEKQAGRTLAIIEDQIRNKVFDPAEWKVNRPFLFEQACKTWISLKQISDLECRERIAKNHLVPYWGKHDIREIRSIHLQEFLKHLKGKDLSDKSCYNIMGELRACLRFHADSIPKLPVFPAISVQEKPIQWLTEEQQEAVFKAIPYAHRAIFDFMRFTGCRPSEARGLLRKNVNKEKGYIVIATVLDGKNRLKDRTKTKRVRVLPLTPKVNEALKNRELGLSPYAFTIRGEPYSRKQIERIWNKACAVAGIKINLYNGLKHSFGCQRLNQGFSLDKIRAVMGHTDRKTTERYAKYVSGSLVDVMDGVSVTKVVQQGENNG